MATKSAIRRLWIGITNGLMIWLIWPSAPQDLQQLHQLSSDTRAVDLQFSAHPWAIAAMVLLAAGALADFFNRRVAAWINIGYYMVALVVALWGITKDWNDLRSEHVEAAFLFYIAPLVVILAVDTYLFRKVLAQAAAASRS